MMNDGRADRMCSKYESTIRESAPTRVSAADGIAARFGVLF